MTQGVQKGCYYRRKHTYFGSTDICCTDEATRRRGRYRKKTVPVRASRTDTYPPDLSFSFCIRRQLYQYGCPPSPLPLSPFLTSSAAWRSRLLCASFLFHLAMKQCPLRRPPGTTSRSLAALAITPSVLRTTKGSFPWTPRRLEKP